MNNLEIIASETYSDKSQYYRDVADPRYKGDSAFRDAINAKLERSLPALRPSMSTGNVRVQRSMNVTRDVAGKPVFTPGATDPGYTPQASDDAKLIASIPEGGIYETLPGGCVRYRRRG